MTILVLNMMQALLYDEEGDLRKAYRWPFGVMFLHNPEMGTALMQRMIKENHPKLQEIDLASLPAHYFTLEAIRRPSNGYLFNA